MKGIKLGEMNTMKVVKEVDFGMYLDGGDEGEILLPTRYVPEGCKPGDTLDVFVYLDQDERPVATTLTPKAMVGEFAYLEVAWTNQFGAFLDWGLMKDLFCPFREQKIRMQKGQRYQVYCYIDDKTYRIVCSSRIEKFQKAITEQKEGKATDTPDERFSNRGTAADRTVIIGDFSSRLFHQLKLADTGFLPYHDKSAAEDIYAAFGVSKKVFKQAVGDLYKQELIRLRPDGIELTIKGKTMGEEE